MRIYYKLKPYAPGKRLIVGAVYEKDLFSAPLEPKGCFHIDVDEVDPDNKGICRNLADATSKRDSEGEGRYFIDADHELCENEGWEEEVEEL